MIQQETISTKEKTDSPLMTLLKACPIPTGWFCLGHNNVKDTDSLGDEYISSYGLVFKDRDKGLIFRLGYLPASERYTLAEKNDRGKYRLVFNYKANELYKVNEHFREIENAVLS